MSFYTPFGVTLFGTAGARMAQCHERKFLYALRRDLVWDFNTIGRNNLAGDLDAFLYALRRDLVWDSTNSSDRIGMRSLGFLYALWRDLVWDCILDPTCGPRFRQRCFYTPFGVTLFGTYASDYHLANVPSVHVSIRPLA